MRNLYVIGIGPGGIDQLTLEAVAVINRCSVFFVIDKGEAKRGLADGRREILAAHRSAGYRIVEVADPPRDRAPADYVGTVRDWHQRRAIALADAFAATPEDVGAILVWGDPSLYDSTLRMIDLVQPIHPVAVTVIPGVTSVSALAAAHAMVLHEIGQPVHTTTGRQLRAGLPDGIRRATVMLDGENSFLALPPETHIAWSAYAGMPQAEHLAGTVAEIGQHIAGRREQLRQIHGWLMDIYHVVLPPTAG